MVTAIRIKVAVFRIIFSILKISRVPVLAALAAGDTTFGRLCFFLDFFCLSSEALSFPEFFLDFLESFRLDELELLRLLS